MRARVRSAIRFYWVYPFEILMGTTGVGCCPPKSSEKAQSYYSKTEEKASDKEVKSTSRDHYRPQKSKNRSPVYLQTSIPPSGPPFVEETIAHSEKLRALIS
jgi:hypothetical protein